MGFGSVEDVKGFTAIGIPAMSYVGKIEAAEDCVSKKENKRQYTKLTILIEDSVPGGQDIDEDLYINPYDSKVYTNCFQILPGDNKFFANGAGLKNKSLEEATGTVESSELVGKQVGFTVSYNKKDGQQEIARFFKAEM